MKSGQKYREKEMFLNTFQGKNVKEPIKILIG